MADQNTPKDEGLEDIKIKHPGGWGMKIGALVGILVAIGGGLAAYYFLLYVPEQEEKAALAVHTDFWNGFTGAHASGYGATWSCIFRGTEESQANSNLKLETLIGTALTQNEAMFGKLVIGCINNDAALLEAVGNEPPPGMVSMDDQIATLDEMKVPEPYAESFEGVSDTLAEIHAAWTELGEYFITAEERGKWDKKLTDVSTKGWGTLYVRSLKKEKPTPNDLANAWRYYKFMTCSLGKDYAEMGDFKTYKALEDEIGKIAIDGNCSTEEKAGAYFPTVEGCAQKYLLASKPDLADEQFQFALKKKWFNETRSLAAIAGSFQDTETGATHIGCIPKARASIKTTGISHLFKASMAYAQSRNDLLKVYKAEKAKFEK